MGCFDIFCFICGNTCHTPFEEFYQLVEKSYRDAEKKTKWLQECTILLQNNMIIKDCIETGCGSIFENVSQEFSTSVDEIHLSMPEVGIFLHNDCYLYACKKVGFKLAYKHFPVVVNMGFLSAHPSINFGDITQYWGQDFYFEDVAADNKLFMIESPLKNSKNATRVNKII